MRAFFQRPLPRGCLPAALAEQRGYTGGAAEAMLLAVRALHAALRAEVAAEEAEAASPHGAPGAGALQHPAEGGEDAREALRAHASAARSPFVSRGGDGAGGDQPRAPAAALLQTSLDAAVRHCVRLGLAALSEPRLLLLRGLVEERRAAAPGAADSPGVLGYALHRLTQSLSDRGRGPAAYAASVAGAVLTRVSEGDEDALATPAGLLLLAPGCVALGRAPSSGSGSGALGLAQALAALPEPSLLDQLCALWALAEGRGRADGMAGAARLLGAHCEAALLASASAHACGWARAGCEGAAQWLGREALGWALQA